MAKIHGPRSGGNKWWDGGFYRPGEPTGNVLYVKSSGTTTGPGFTPETPYSTIVAAIGACTANNGDVIRVMAGHAETITVDIDLNVAGVTIEGEGVGETRPVVTIGAVGAKLDVDAANCKVSGIVFKIDADDVTTAIDVDGAGFVLEGCEILEGAGADEQALISVDIAEDRCTVRNCYIKSVTAGANSGIKISAAKDRITLIGNEIFGDFADACIHNPTSAIATRLRIDDNVLTNLQSGDHAIELVSACTGVINRNIVNSTLAAAGTAGALDGGSCFMNQNYGVDATADVQGILNPAADA